MVYSQLLVYSYGKELVLDLAERYEAINATTFEFQIRKGVKFHDGTPLTSADVIASFKRIVDPSIGASSYQYLNGITSMNAKDDYTVQFQIKEPQATFIPGIGLTGSYIAQKKLIDAKTDFEKVVIGTGPFKFVSRTVGVNTKVERNPDYFLPGLPYLDSIVFTPIFDDSARMNALYAGDQDLVEYVPWAQMSKVEKDDKLILQSNATDGFVMIEFRVDQPPFNNPKLRQAVSYGIDREAIIKTATSGRGAPCYGGIIPPWMWGYNKDLENYYKYDPEKAKQLVKEAGAEGLNIQYITWPSTNQLFGLPSVVVANQLKEIGLNVTLVPQQTATWSLNRQQGNYHMFMDGNLYDLPDPDFLSDYYETGYRIPAANRYSNKQVDSWLTEARKLSDRSQRTPLYEDVQKTTLEDEPIAWLFYREQGEAMQKYVKGHAYLGSLGANQTLLYTWLDK